MSKEEFNLIRPFGPPVMKVRIPEEIIHTLNNYVDEIVKNKKKSKELDHGNYLAGDVTQEIKLEPNIINSSKWGEFLSRNTAKWIQLLTQKKITEFKILDSWVVRQFKTEYNPIHWHNGHISGAGYLKVPKNLGSHKQNKEKMKNTYTGGHLQLIHGSKMFLSSPILSISPEVGDFYFFPHYLLHTVMPFKGTDEERRSISFNAEIDNNIYDVYANN
tara:strand:- start:118 stop:768 length:651 start_codon:yes stop_codon:yes gene_type:complete